MVAPIALFVYNRPWHTRRTVETLAANEQAELSDLFIFSDAPKNTDAQLKVEEVRQYVKTISGFRTITIVEKEKNWGLAQSVISGVTQLCEKFGRAIIVEDDLISSPFFLRFMNEALDMYEHESTVMHVSGSTYPIDLNDRVESYFLHLPLCWGWATWDRAWRKFRKDIHVMDYFDSAMKSRFTFDNTFPNYWEQLEGNRDGHLNTWFIFWYAILFLENGLSLFPRQSMLRNIGMDGSGVHCSSTSDFDVTIIDRPIQLAPLPQVISEEAYARHKRYFARFHPTILQRLRQKIRTLIKRAASIKQRLLQA